MKFSGWAFAAVACLRKRQFWREVMRKAFYLVAKTSNGLGVA
jgi:hypothetical protein